MVKIAIIEDDEVQRVALRAILKSMSSQIEVLEFKDCEGFLDDESAVDLLVLDNYLARGESIGQIKLCETKCPKIIVYSSDSKLAHRFLAEGITHVALAKENSLNLLRLVVSCYLAGKL